MRHYLINLIILIYFFVKKVETLEAIDSKLDKLTETVICKINGIIDCLNTLVSNQNRLIAIIANTPSGMQTNQLHHSNLQQLKYRTHVSNISHPYLHFTSRIKIKLNVMLVMLLPLYTQHLLIKIFIYY